MPKDDANYDVLWSLTLVFGAALLFIVYADYNLENIKTTADVARAFIEVLVGLILIIAAAQHFLSE